MKNRPRLLNLALVLAMLFCTVGFFQRPVEAAASDLFFSEYIEGSSSNKALEIYNGTGTTIDLRDYKVTLYSNGATTPNYTLTWADETLLADGDVYIIANASAVSAITDIADITHSVTFFNGNDAIALQKVSDDSIVDVLGTIGDDTFWGAEVTLVRKETICDGDTDPNDAFDFADEWDDYPQDTFDYLGSHTTNCTAPTEFAPTVLSSVPVDSEAFVPIDTNITVTFSEPVTVTDTWFDITCSVSGSHTGTVTDANPEFIIDPDVDFEFYETCTVTVYASNVNDDDLEDPPDVMESDFTFGFTTIGTCGDPFTAIYEIQGSGMSTPIPGEKVATEGVVVGDFQEGGKYGFFIQDLIGDIDEATSDGIFVYEPFGVDSIDVALGDKVRVVGTVSEYYDLTQISMSNISLCSTEHPLPSPAILSLPVNSVEDFEVLEGMYVTIPQDLVIAEYFNFDRYGEIVLSSERFMTFTAANEPDISGFAASEEEYFLSTITLDDGRTNQNPDPAIHPNGLEFTMDNLFRGGDLVANVTGVMDYSFSLYRIQPTQGADYTSENSRPDTLEIEEGTLKVASFNVLNYFTTIDTIAYVCGPVEFVDVIGKIGEDPGSYWGTDPKTQDQTLIRKPGICVGDWESIDDFDPVNEWDSLGLNYFDDLGSHTTTCVSFDDLIISEYIEGSSNNKALEIYNGTGNTVDLRDYKVAIYFNGEAQEPSTMLTWDSETLLADGEVYVITNTDADAEIKAEADIILSYPSVAHFNGDDVVALMKAGPDGMECRGADTEEELIRQKDKILAAMSEIDADVFGLMEIENDRIGPPSDYAVADLVAGLNDIVGAGTYDYIATGAIGTDAIKVALLYKPASVTPVGDYEILDSTVDPRFIDTKNRPTLAQVFEDNLTGETFTVAVNHLKSKGSPCVDVGDPDLGDGAGNCNITRLDAAQAMVDWLADETIFSEVDNILIIGDLNSYDKEDPIDAIKAGSDDTTGTDDDYFDMIYEILGENAYGYVFDGKIGYLDYALASTNIKDNILDIAIWHINADEPDLIDYDMSFKQDAQDALYVPDKYRSSDHDPVIVSLRMNEGPTAVDDVYETDQDVTLNVPAPGVMENDSDPNPNDELWVDIKTGPSHGELTLNDDGSFIYIPDPGFFGVDTFEYYLIALPPEMRSDYMDIGLVTITVKPKYQFFVPLVINN